MILKDSVRQSEREESHSGQMALHCAQAWRKTLRIQVQLESRAHVERQGTGEAREGEVCSTRKLGLELQVREEFGVG